jgi:23S rRNA pseudouridine1911/1915/1917 synthase
MLYLGEAMPSRLRILFEDNHLLGVAKEAGRLVQGDRTGDETLLSLARDYLKIKYRKTGGVFIGLVHRLDRPVSGVVVFARTSKAASRLAAEFRLRRVEKTYLAVIEGRPQPAAGVLVSDIIRTHKRSRISRETSPKASPKAKTAELSYRLLASVKGLSLVEIKPATGRHHQIRVQLSGAGFPIVGDLKYGASEGLKDRSIALHAVSLAFKHPVREEQVRLETPPPNQYPWKLFPRAIAARFE